MDGCMDGHSNWCFFFTQWKHVILVTLTINISKFQYNVFHLNDLETQMLLCFCLLVLCLKIVWCFLKFWRTNLIFHLEHRFWQSEHNIILTIVLTQFTHQLSCWDFRTISFWKLKLKISIAHFTFSSHIISLALHPTSECFLIWDRHQLTTNLSTENNFKK